MLYFQRMTNKFPGYEITQQDIETALQYLRTNENKNATREDAVSYLEEKHAQAHIAAHKIVEDEKNGKIPKQKVEDPEKS